MKRICGLKNRVLPRKVRHMSDEPIIDLQSDQYFMGEALRQALRAYEAEEVPIGAVVVRGRKNYWTGVQSSRNAAGRNGACRDAGDHASRRAGGRLAAK